MNQKLEFPCGIIASNADTFDSIPDEKYYFFEGDLHQVSEARKIADLLGVKTGKVVDLPYVTNEHDFRKVMEYIIEMKIDGYEHYMEKYYPKP